jgi:hypothetical protein
LRINFFSTAMRMLFEHMMEKLAPPDQVTQCTWFKPERQNGKPTRAQSILFAIHGGLSEHFVRKELKLDPLPLRKRLLAAVDHLSKQVHGRENTIIRDQGEQDREAVATIDAMAEFLDAVRDCRAAVLEPITERLDDAAVEALLSETILEVDELATHHSVEGVYVDDVAVHTIGPHFITYRASGSVSVVLQWGSNSDLRRGDGAELSQSFPFRCDIEVSLHDPWDLHRAEATFGVDTGEWYGRPSSFDLNAPA